MSEKSYLESQTDRFEIADDGYSRERVEALAKLREELQTEFGMRIAFVLFGSLTKGKILTAETAGSTDIDMSIFFDYDDYRKDFKGLLRRLAEEPENKHIVKAVMSGHTPLTYSGNLEGYFIDSCLQQRIARLVYGEDGHLFLVREVRSLPLAHAGYRSMYQITTDWLKYRNWGNEATIAVFFAMDIGDSMKEYRKEFFEQLAVKGKEEAERIWTQVHELIENFERRKGIPEGMQGRLPATFEAAARYYGANIGGGE